MSALVQTDAGLHGRGYAQAKAPQHRIADPRLLLWRRLLNHAVADAKKVKDGLPTDLAILARWWISDYRPARSNGAEWERSFECTCHWLDLDVVQERKRLLAQIDAALKEAWLGVWFRAVYRRRAAVLSCAGEQSAIARQYILPLVNASTYDEVAGIDGPDMFAEET